MKKWLNGSLFILIFILFISCDKSKNNIETQDVDDIIEIEITPVIEFIEETEEFVSITDYIINLFGEITPGMFSRETDNTAKNNVTSLDSIKAAQGYYTQQRKKYSIYRRCPEILSLSVENDVVYLREIDIADEQIVTRNEKKLNYDGVTYSHDNTKLEIQNGKIQIIYSETAPEQTAVKTWDYSSPYRFTGTFDSPYEDVTKLTTGYLNGFTGEYFFDTFVIIDTNDPYINEERFRNKVLKITLDQEHKCLLLTSDLFNTLGISLDYIVFIETENEEPFFLVLSEDAGYAEIFLYFYKDGIILIHDSVAGSDGGYEVKVKKYGVFFKKK